MQKSTGLVSLDHFGNANDPLPKNTAVVIDRDGRILTNYAKMHLFSIGHEHEGRLTWNGSGNIYL